MRSSRAVVSVFRSYIAFRILANSIIFCSLRMQSVPTTCPLSLIFRPIPPETIAKMTSDPLCLESPFFLNNSPQEVQVVLSKQYLALCEKGFFSNVYHYYTELTFELKFEMLYVEEKKVGFRLSRQNAPPVEMRINCENLIDIWEKYLTKSLSQLGFHNLYRPIRKLGKGGFATVYEVERTSDHKHFAVKAFSKQNTLNSPNLNQRLNLLNEIAIMRKSDCPHILKIEGVFESDNSLYVVMDLVTSGQLHTRINRRQGVFQEQQIKQFMVGMAKALKEMAENRILHRDIKPENIMLRGDDGLFPIIADFGLAANADSEDYLFYRCGTPGYVAPEITRLLKGEKAEPQCDIFSTGVIFHILLTRKPLFQGRKFEEVYENNRKMKFNLTSPQYKTIDPIAMDLLNKMLKIDPKERIKASEMLTHPYLASYTGSDMQDEWSVKACGYGEMTEASKEKDSCRPVFTY